MFDDLYMPEQNNFPEHILQIFPNLLRICPQLNSLLLFLVAAYETSYIQLRHLDIRRLY